MAPTALTRRGAVQSAAAAAAGLATATTGAGTAFAGRDHGHRRDRDVPVPPEPIPGGIELGPDQVIHVWAPGPPDITLPYTGVVLQGLDVEPTTIRDFKGFSAVAFHVGTATGSDGELYDFETDVRAFRGTYVDGDGERRFGTFGFI
jgi:hypothetical protein